VLLPARKTALVAAAVAVVVLFTLGFLFAGQQDPTALDQRTFDEVSEHVPHGWLHYLKAPTNPVLLIIVLGAVAVTAVAIRRFDVALLAVVGPLLGVVLASFVLKHVFGRRYYGGYLAYPSGHTTAMTATVLVVVIAVATLGRPRLTVAAAVLAVLGLTSGVIGLVGLDYHYVTDTVGGMCVAGATIAAVSFVLDSDGIRRYTHGDQRQRGVHSMK
jgi:undecaprenyl-diphosphatase